MSEMTPETDTDYSTHTPIVSSREYILAQSRAMGGLVKAIADTSSDPADSQASQFAFVSMFAHLNEHLLKRMGVTLPDYETVMGTETPEIARHLEELEWFAKKHGLTLPRLIALMEARGDECAPAVKKLKSAQAYRERTGKGNDVTLEELGCIVRTRLDQVNGHEVNLTCIYPAVVPGNGEGPYLAYNDDEIGDADAGARPAVEVIRFPLRHSGLAAGARNSA